MTINDHIKITKISGEEIAKPADQCFYSIIWIIGTIDSLMIEGDLYEGVTNTMFFLHPKYQWKLFKGGDQSSKGYVLYLSDTILNEPFLNRLQINEIRILHASTVHRAHIAPGIEMRLQVILEMLDELITTRLNHREDAILALINTFFVYCDGQCNVKLNNCTHNSKSVLVYNYVRILSENITEMQRVSQYAAKLNVSTTYLNECTHEVMGVSAKSLIIEQMVMRTRHALKFTDKSTKEIAYELGFSSPDYFSAFCKKHTGLSPSDYKKA